MFKYKLSTLFIFIMILSTANIVSAYNYKPILIGKVIYIDAGHGGADPGAIYKDTKESDINLEISNKLSEELEKYGAIVYKTRIDDYDLSKNNTHNKKRSDLRERARIINESKCDIYISIHLNSEKSSTWNGAQVFYTQKNKSNKIIAEKMQKLFKENLDTKREAKEIKNTYLFDRLERPGVLVEAGFISNPNDRYLLKKSEYQQKIVSIITKGVIDYLK